MSNLFSEDAIERFKSKYTELDPDYCWLWQGAVARYGHGSFRFNGKTGVAHRFAWMLANQQMIPEGLVIRHWCDTPACVNPNHLELGTQQDNINDMLERTYVPVEFCKRGHPFTPENTETFLKPNGRIQRNCKTCKKSYQLEYQRMYRQRKKGSK